MGFDWLTFIAQVVNFLFLVWLLKRFLFGRITEAMERRETRIADRLEEAAELRRGAEEEGHKLTEMQRELAERRQEILDHAEAEAASRREELLAEARRQLDRDQAGWRASLAQEKQAFLQELRRKTAVEVLELCRRILQDLAGEDLDRRVAVRLAERLAGLDPESRQQLSEALQEAGGQAQVESAQAVAEPERRSIRQALTAVAPVESVEWRQRANLGFGFKVRAGGWQVGWSLESYLDALEARVGELLEPQPLP